MRTTAITFLPLSVRYILLVVGVMQFAVAEETAPPSSSPSRPSPTSPSPPVVQSNFSPFRPSIAVIIGFLTTLFSVTFLILLYAKHCKRTDGVGRAGHPSYAYGYGGPASSYRRNSGVDRKVIDSLPVFRFASLRGPKDGLECAVCLNRFEPAEILRLLPKCKHAFHVECVDTWLESHSTCPLCRYRVAPEDVLLIIEEVLEPAAVHPPPPHHPPPKQEVDIPAATARVSGRHSSAGEKSTRSHIVSAAGSSSLTRVSADGGVGRKRFVGAVWSVGCFDRGGGAIRKDVLLLPDAVVSDRESFERRLSHRIIVSDSPALKGRRSELKTTDLLFLRSEMIFDSGRYSFGPSDPSRRSVVSSAEKHPFPEVRLDVSNDAVSSRNSGGHGLSPSESPSEPGESVAAELPFPEVDFDVVNDSVSGAGGGHYGVGPSESCAGPGAVVSALEGRKSPEARGDLPKFAVPGRFLKPGLINSPNPRSMSEITGLTRLSGRPSVENKWHNRFSIS